MKTGEDIEKEFGIPIVNKRISVTPISMVAGACETEDYVPLRADTGPRRRSTCGVNFIGGFSALVQKGCTTGDRKLIRVHPRGAGGHRAGLRQRERWLHQGGHQHGRRGGRWAASSRKPPS